MTQRSMVPRSRAAAAHSSTSACEQLERCERWVATLALRAGAVAGGHSSAGSVSMQQGRSLLGVCAVREGRDADALRTAGSAQRIRSEGGRGLSREAGRRGSPRSTLGVWMVQWVQWVQWVQRQCREQRRTRGRPLSSIGCTTEACREGSAEAGGDQGVCSMWRVEGVRGVRCGYDSNEHARKQFGAPSPLRAQHLQRAIPPWKLSRSANCSRSIFSPPNSPPCQMTCVACRPSAGAFVPNCALPSGCPKLSIAVARHKRVRVPAQRCSRALPPGPAMPVRRALGRAAWLPAVLKRLRTHWLTNVCVH